MVMNWPLAPQGDKMRRDPFQEMFEEMQRMQRDMHKLTRRVRPTFVVKQKGNKELIPEELKIRNPVTAMKETESAIIADIELPGMHKEDIQLNVTTRNVEVAAKQKIEKKEDNYYAASERSFYKSFSLPAEVDPNTVDAEFKNGILHLKLNKAKQVQNKKRIQIK